MFHALTRRRGPIVVGLPALLAACWLLWLPASAGMAAGTVLSTGFESPFTLGPLENQLGWLTAGSGASSATVQNSVVHTGSQALLVTRTANSDRRWAVPNLQGLPTQRFVAVDWDMRVAGPAGNPEAEEFGPFFGVEAYDDDNPDKLIRVLGSLGVDATTGDVLYQIQDSGELTESGRTVAFNQWYHFKLVLDFLNDTYVGFVNGMMVADTGFVDRGFNLDDFTDADIAAFAAGFDPVSQTLSSSAAFDNFIIRDGIPGDYDADGDVDNADYVRWRSEFGTTETPGHGSDGNSDGSVDAADYVVWRINRGLSLFPTSGLGSAVVPEPASLVMGLLAALLASIGARSRHRS